jgi:hypothetical protein
MESRTCYPADQQEPRVRARVSKFTWRRAANALLVAALAIEGLLLLRPDGALVHAAQPRGYRSSHEAAVWFRSSPVHMGCSIATCARPATRTVSYRFPGARGVTWRAYGFCDLHAPPPSAEGLVYRLGRPPVFSYDLPLAPVWAEIYLLLGVLGFGVWCACLWRWSKSVATVRGQVPLFLLHALVLAGLALY